MPSNTEDVFRRLSALLLRGPRDPRKYESPVFRRSEEILKHVGYSPENSPVAGVAMHLDEMNKPTVSLLLNKDVKEFSDFLSGFLRLDFRIGQMTIGPIVLTARPTTGGESLGQGISKWQSGTFGCLVANAAEEKFLLSCHHVLSGMNSGKRGLDPVWQPSFKDGGQAKDRVGLLYDFAPVKFGGADSNRIDAALVKPADPNAVAAGIKGIGPVAGTARNIVYKLPVKKVGWKTGHTRGNFLYRTNYIQHYPGHGDALFENQLGIFGTREKVFSQDGDSGSLVVNENNEAVGLVFASSPDTGLTFANPIESVFDYFGVAPV